MSEPVDIYRTKQPASAFLHAVTDSHVYFWGAPSFGNFTIAPFTYKDTTFNCSEQAFMWQKAMHFKDEECAKTILSYLTPGFQKNLGRQVKNFTDLPYP